MIKKPMLAGKCSDTSALSYPVLCTPKLDGVRALVVDGKCVSRNFKPIRNTYVRNWIEKNCPSGFDGELIVPGGSFQNTTSSIMSEDGQPAFQYHVFDFVKTSLDEPYDARMKNLETCVHSIEGDTVKAILPVLIRTEEELLAYEKKCLADGYEGVMIRDPKGKYKCGRSTEKEGLLLKLKRFEDGEATIVSIEEKMHNENEAKEDAFGHTKRSTAKAGMVPAGTMGELRVKCKDFTNEFGIGTGFDDALRAEIWKNRKTLIGKVIKFKYQAIGGTTDAPRFPVFLGFRDENDMGGE